MADFESFLPSFARHLRNGKTYEISGPLEGRVIWTANRFRLGRDHLGEIRLQIQIETHLASGLRRASSWGQCHWTIDDLLTIRDEAAAPNAQSTKLEKAVVCDDLVVNDLIDLMSGRPIVLSGVSYHLDDDAISAVDGETLIRPNPTSHSADYWIADRLSADQEHTIRNRS